jgi:hypothetical protein
MTEKIPICWKCASSIIEPNDDEQGYNLKGCKEEKKIHSYRDAEKLCPLLKEMKKTVMKKLFFVQYEVSDNGHDHVDYAYCEAKDENEAREITEVKHDESGLDLEDEPMAYGDGLTSTKVRGIREITPNELKNMRKFISLPNVTEK